jgi:Na+-driven multidrug efflux pump
MQLVSCVLQCIQNRQLGFYGNLYGQQHHLDNGGDLAISVWGILFVVFMMVMLPLLGLNQGLQPIVGYNIGAHRFDRVRRALKLAISSQLVFTVFCGAAFFLFPEYLIVPFTNPDSPDRAALIHLGGHALRIVCSVLPFAGIVIIAAGYFQSNGMPKTAIALTLFRQVGILVPLLFALPWFFESLENYSGLDGVWSAFMISDISAFLLATFFLWRELRRLKRG